MKLVTPAEAKTVLWEGELELGKRIGAQRTKERISLSEEPPPPAGTTIPDLPTVSIGQPEVWRLEELYDKGLPVEFGSKLGEFRFVLARFVCSFRLRSKDNTLDFARFVVKLLKDGVGHEALAYDLFPKTVVQERKKNISVTLSPSFKFSEIEASVGKAGFELAYPELVPFVSAAGAGEDVADWSYEGVEGMPLVGFKWMHMVIRAPLGMEHCEAQMDVSADIRVKSWLFGAHLKRQGVGSGLGARLW